MPAMFNSVPVFIGRRYIGSKRSNGFIAFVSLFALIGMALGVFALIVVLSVMNGFDHELKGRILRVIPHGILESNSPWQEIDQKIKGSEGLMASAPFISGQGLLSFRSGVRGVQLHGVLPNREKEVSVIDDFTLIGSLEDLQPGHYNIVLGRLSARYLGVNVGDKVTITLPVVSVSLAGVFPRTKRFTVVGVFEVGAQQDETLGIIHIADAQKLFRMGNNVDGLRLKFDNIYKAAVYGEKIQRQLAPDVEVNDWSQTQGSLFQAVKMEKTVVGVMLSIIVAVAAFNIVTSLVMLVTEKRSDIAVLRTMGLSRAGVIKIFITQGTLMGTLGILVGSLSGVITAVYLPNIMMFLESTLGLQLFDPNVYFVTQLPSVWRLSDTLVVCSIAFIISFLATIYPAYRASKISPAEALRYDT